MYEAERGDLPDQTYVLCADEISRILYRPHIAGKELQDGMDRVSEVFVDAMHRQALAGKSMSRISEMVFLAGGLYYKLNHGFKKRFGMAIPQCFLGIKRQRVEGSGGRFTAVATYENFESLPDQATIIIGDTIATGATIQKGIFHLFDAMAVRKLKLESLIVCSLACSVEGARLLKDVQKRMERDFPGSSLHLFVAEELFHLMPDGTDLRFLYDDALMPQETRDRILKTYGGYLGKEMKCAVFDWGTRCKNPIKHYHEFLEFADEAIGRCPDEKSGKVLGSMRDEARLGLDALGRRL